MDQMPPEAKYHFAVALAKGNRARMYVEQYSDIQQKIVSGSYCVEVRDGQLTAYLTWWNPLLERKQKEFYAGRDSSLPGLPQTLIYSSSFQPALFNFVYYVDSLAASLYNPGRILFSTWAAICMANSGSGLRCTGISPFAAGDKLARRSPQEPEQSTSLSSKALAH
ncbi:hypothetical protein GQ44DRAFT_494133 [Phaeosphaeriaceae sp. PMI808]|nr:hypothetical protein GQ44DRAFT_494133 [Phaeosphaeriaceae sp. PMI808]